MTIVEIEPGLIVRRTRGLADAGSGEQKIVRAVAIGIENKRWSVVDRHTAGEGRGGIADESIVRTSKTNLRRVEGRAAENQIVFPIAVQITDRDTGPASILANREQ